MAAIGEKVIYATGRRKRAVARVFMFSGKGKRTINERDIKVYFNNENQERIIEQPLELLNVAGLYDVIATVVGGGMSGQAGAVRLGISRCLAQLDEQFRKTLRHNGFMTRDAREVERKKYGLAGARRRYQFSKR